MKKQVHVARETGISAGYLSKILNGHAAPSPAQLEAILAAYGLSSSTELRELFPRYSATKAPVKVTAEIVQGSGELQLWDIPSVIEHLRSIEEKSGIKIALTVTTS